MITWAQMILTAMLHMLVDDRLQWRDDFDEMPNRSEADADTDTWWLWSPTLSLTFDDAARTQGPRVWGATDMGKAAFAYALALFVAHGHGEGGAGHGWHDGVTEYDRFIAECKADPSAGWSPPENVPTGASLLPLVAKLEEELAARS
jgi:hypothetical protein